MKKTMCISRGWRWLTAIAVTGFLFACGGGDGGRATILGVDGLGIVATPLPPVTVVTPPTVTVVSPLPNAIGVATNTALVTAAFSKAMDPTSITASSFTLTCPSSPAAAVGTVNYIAPTYVATRTVPATLAGTCTATVTTAVRDSTGAAMLAPYSWQFTLSEVTDVIRPSVVTVNPVDVATNVATNSPVVATFDEAINPLSITSTQFTVSAAGVNIAGAVSLSPLGKIATFQPTAALQVDTLYTATVTNLAADLAGNTLLANKVWTFRTAALATVAPAINLITAAPFGTFGGTAGMTNQGTLTVINGDIGSIATGTTAITGFHDAANIYTQTGSNAGNVTGKIFTCTNSTTGSNSAGPSAPDCAVATQARLDAQTAYLALVARPVGGASPAPGANLAGATLQAGTYKAPGGSFLIQGGDLTLVGDANAVWVFQMATTLTVGGPGAAAPQNIILAGGALAKNVFWQVGSAATINAGGGGTMVGTIIAQDGVTFSTAGNVALVTLNGRALSLGASVTMVNTVINVPAP
jgi:hypothetical protein